MFARFDGYQPADYPPPRKHVLLLSCMDLRVMDDIVRFMNRDNLTNRYDHVVLAGAALGAMFHKSWGVVFFEHLDTACRLHDIHDIYILEHRNCGAYGEFLGEAGKFDDSRKEQEKETSCHAHYALGLADRIEAWAKKKERALGIRCFLMDLRGDVKLLTHEDIKEVPKKKSGKKRKS